MKLFRIGHLKGTFSDGIPNRSPFYLKREPICHEGVRNGGWRGQSKRAEQKLKRGRSQTKRGRSEYKREELKLRREELK